MIKKLNLKEIRKALNEDKKFKLIYEKSTFPFKHDCVLIEMQDLIKEKSCLYGDINNVVTSDKKELLMMLKVFDVALRFEKQEDVIKSTLIKIRHTDPMNLLIDYYDLPILTATSPKLKRSIHKLNDEIINLGITEDLVRINKSYYPMRYQKNIFILI